MKRKSGLSKFNGFLAIVLVICVVATAFVINKYPKIEDASADDSSIHRMWLLLMNLRQAHTAARSLKLRKT